MHYYVGQTVRPTHDNHGCITPGKDYVVIQVDEQDAKMPVQVLDDVGDKWWLHANLMEIVEAAKPIDPLAAALNEAMNPARADYDDALYASAKDGWMTYFRLLRDTVANKTREERDAFQNALEDAA